MSDTLYFKDDWASSKRMLNGWWNQRVEDRWALGVCSPRTTPLSVSDAPELADNFRENWLNRDGNFLRSEAHFSRTAFHGALYPEATALLGPGSLNAFLGTPVDFQKETVWYNEVYDDPSAVEILRVEPDNFYWNWTKETLQFLTQKATGRFVVTMPDLIEGLDTLSELFGPQNLMMQMLDEPDEIHRLLNQLDAIYMDVYNELADLIATPDGEVPYMAFNVFAPGRSAKIQCDFSIMISQEMFDEFALPHLRRQTEQIDYTVYHLDGPDAVRHLDSVLSLPELNAVQWSPGAGNPHSAHPDWWTPVWKKVYAAGKSALMMNVPQGDVEPFVREFGPEGTMILTHAETEDDAKRIMDVSLGW